MNLVLTWVMRCTGESSRIRERHLVWMGSKCGERCELHAHHQPHLGDEVHRGVEHDAAAALLDIFGEQGRDLRKGV